MALPDHNEEIAAALAELAQLLGADESLEASLERIVALCCETIPDCDIATITLVMGGAPRTVASTDALGTAIDTAQYQAEAGPCLESAATAQPLNSPDLWVEDRWPAFRDAAVARGLKSCASSPLLGRDGPVGSINLYSRQARALGSAVTPALSMFAAHGAVAVVAAEMRQKATELAEQMQAALASRAVIDQAKGIVMAQQGCGPDAAFDHLRRLSQDTNRKLRDIAADMVERASRRELRGETGVEPDLTPT